MPEIGDKIRIIYMAGEPHYSGKEGIVKSITEDEKVHYIHGTWGGCALIPESDWWEIIDE